MKNVLAIAMVCGICCMRAAAETNLLVFSYSTSRAANEAYPDIGRRLNDGAWKVGDIVRFDDTVAVSLDLCVPTALEQVSVRTGSGVSSRTAAVTVEGSVDGATWFGFGALQAGDNDVFFGTIVCSRVRYLRVTCQKDAAFAYQDLKEVVVTGRQAITQGLMTFSYVPSQGANPFRTDSITTPKLCDNVYTSAVNGTVQYGPSSTDDIAAHPDDPLYVVATNLALVVDFGGGTTTVERLTCVSLFAHASNNNGSWGTDGIVVSNSVDGIAWQFIAVQTNFTVLPGDQYGTIKRFDVLLPYSTSRYLTVVAQKQAKASILRQLLTELRVTAATLSSSYQVGAAIPYTYTVDKSTSNTHESPYAPKLTDLCYDHNTRNALRFYEELVTVTADLNYPQYIHSGFAYTWGSPTKYGSSADYYGTQRVDCYGSLDGTTWTFFGSLNGKNAATFAELPYYRYVKATFVRADSTENMEVSSQIIGELAFYGLPRQSIGSLIEVPGAIPFAGFETTPSLSEATLIQGGSTNGWTFTALDASNYAGIQINGSSVSTNIISFAKFVAPEGVQTAVMRGKNVYMETLITVPQNGHYLLKMQASSLVYGTANEQSGYNFTVSVDAENKGLVDVLTLPYASQTVYLGGLEAGTHTLRFSAVNSRNSPAGTLIDDLTLFRIPELSEIAGTAVRKSQSLIMSSTEPVVLNYIGKYYIRNLVVDGQNLQHSVYSADTTPSLFSGYGSLRFEDGLSVLIR